MWWYSLNARILCQFSDSNNKKNAQHYKGIHTEGLYECWYGIANQSPLLIPEKTQHVKSRNRWFIYLWRFAHRDKTFALSSQNCEMEQVLRALDNGPMYHLSNLFRIEKVLPNTFSHRKHTNKLKVNWLHRLCKLQYIYKNQLEDHHM